MSDATAPSARGQRHHDSAIRPAVRNDRRAHVRARRHRALALAMMALMAVASLGMIAYFVVTSGILTEDIDPRQVSRKSAAAPQAERPVSDKSVKMLAPKLTGFDRKSQAYVLTAESAEQDESDPQIVYLDKVVADLTLKKSGHVISVSADRGTYKSGDETLMLEGHVRVRSTAGYSAVMESAEVYMQEGRVISREPVTVSMPAGQIDANGVELSNDGANIRFLDRPRMTLQQQKKEQ